MSASRLPWAVAVLAILVMSVPHVAGAASEYGGASATEYVLLPKFCWGQYADGLKGPEYNIPSGCGVGMNHYCYGLLDLQRSKKAKNAGERRLLLTHAQDHTRYTIRWMKQEGTTATCSIGPHVEATMREIELKFKIYGIK